MVRLTDGQYLSQCIVMPTLPIYRKLGVKVLLRGHAGELMHMHKAYNYSLDADALGLRSEADLEAWLARRLQAYILRGVDRPLFRGERQEEIASLARASLRQSLVDSSDEPNPVQRLWRCFVSQRLARETVLSLMKFRSVVEVRLPYLDAELIDLLLAAPVELKLSETIQTHMLQRLNPAFLRVPNSNTGAPVGASPLHRKAASLKMRVLAKLGAPGYQPYERLGLWLRREIAPLVRKILLADECLDRGVFNPETVRSVVANHLDASKNHTFLLMALLVFETGQRRLNQQSLNPEPSATVS
jgi:asparagine synthase (glutamine-hydrolysing)